jgi:hypothetical protein
VSESAPATQPRPAGTADRYAKWALLAALVLLVLGLLWKGLDSARMSFQLFAYPYQFDESEGMIVAETGLLTRGVSIYEKPSPELFIAAPYPPVYYLLTWPLQTLAGERPTFKIGRAISILAAVAAGLLVFAILLHLSRDLAASALGAAAWWSLGLVAFWGSLVKPDMLALALGLGGLYVALRSPPRLVYWALPFFIAAFFTKQTAIAAGFAVVGWLLLTRWRTGLAFAALYLAGTILPSVALNAATGGGYFYHMFTIHDLPWFPGRFAEFATGFFRAYGAFLLPGMLALVLGGVTWVRAKAARRTVGSNESGYLFLLGYLVVAIVAATGTGTHGGNHNHLLEWAAASSLGLGVGAAMLRRSPSLVAGFGGAVAALLLLTQVPTLFQTPRWLGLELRVPPAAYTEGMNNVFQYVTNAPGDAYSDNVGLLVIAGKRLWTTDPFTQTHATFFGRWDESRLVQAIRERRFSQIALRIDVDAPDAGAGDVSPGILQAVRDSYKLDQRNVENIYVPR